MSASSEHTINCKYKAVHYTIIRAHLNCNLKFAESFPFRELCFYYMHTMKLKFCLEPFPINHYLATVLLGSANITHGNTNKTHVHINFPWKQLSDRIEQDFRLLSYSRIQVTNFFIKLFRCTRLKLERRIRMVNRNKCIELGKV